ncbi:MAG TPA: DUF4350 domain-containing protein [Segeticoccus sp.]|uniref:DUF4350 domain-containing protein n=1 Tax=Segeticoccus sp. TaxID=2706531 RepID=UPI002D7F07D5|nr:DUF4350 domain-containing protein [Segeticoccus sp.]HET8602188.1 DUF4350 domain-containing protein [Segeticoccus sp.]
MSAPATLDRPTEPGPAPSRSRAGRRWRAPVLWGVAVLVVAAALTLIALGQQRNSAALDPDNVQPHGTHALVQVLRDHGVQVTVVRSQRQLLAADPGPGTTLVVTDTEQLSAHTARTARRAAAHSDRIVLVQPGRAAIRGFALPVERGPGTAQPTTAHCATGDVRRGDRITGTRSTYVPDPGAPAEVCFPGPGGTGGSVVTVPATDQRPQAVLLGSTDLLTNGTITRADHAGVAVRALGHSPRLVWYVANVEDISATDQSAVSTIVPAWFTPALLLLGSAALVLILWRGRRLGRLVTEPLPVVVRATETTESRGRLYRKARDRDRTLAVLQAATRRRLTARLGLPPGSSPEALASAVAKATGRHTAAVAHLLGRPPAEGTPPPPVADDATMLNLARELARLEEEVRRR